ncbi:MAG: hypothetical protein ACXACE_15255 [Candidatus Thorarchaeota archaeon]|jgi:hypothetical protein
MTTEDNMRFGCLGMIAAITFWVALVALDALADPRVAAEALVKKQELYAVELVGVAFDRLSEVIRHGEPQHMLSAVRLLHQLTSTDWLPQQKGQEKKEEVIEIAGLLEELDGGEPETED